MGNGVPEFVEPNLDHSRKKIFRLQANHNIFDIPVSLHLQKSESLRDLEIDELSENQ